jgi:lysyl-tRNA synthetase class I
MRRALILNFHLLLVAVFAACAAPDERTDILPRGKFVQVLADMQLLEARVQQEMTLQPLASIPADDYAQEVFARHGTSVAEFRRSFEHYAADNALMAGIYEDVISELSHRKDSLGHVADPR